MGISFGLSLAVGANGSLAIANPSAVTEIEVWAQALASYLRTAGARELYDKTYFQVPADASHQLGTSDALLPFGLYAKSTGQQVLWEQYQDASNYVRFELDPSTKLHFVAVIGGITKVEIIGATALSINTYHHGCVSLDRSSAAGCKMWLDDLDDTAGTPTTSTDSITTTATTMTIGASPATAAALYFTGYIESIGFFKPTDVTAIDAAAVAALYNAGGVIKYGSLSSAQRSAWGITAFYDGNENAGSLDLVDKHGTADGVKTHDNLFANPGFETLAGHTWSNLTCSDWSVWRASTPINPGAADFAIALFFNASTVGPGFYSFCATGAAAAGRDGFWLYIDNGDIVLRLCDTAEAGEYNHKFTCALSAGTTYFLVLNCDRDGNAELFINNASKGTDSIADYNDILGYTDNTEIGCLNATMQHRYDGKLSKFMYYEGHLLTSDERTWLFNSGVGRVSGEIDALGSGDLYDHLVHCWDGTDPSGTTLTDQWGANECTATNYSYVQNGTWDINTDNWTAAISSVLSSVAGGYSNNCLQIENGADAYGYAHQGIATVAGHEYTLTFDHKNGTAQGFYCVGTTPGADDVQGVTALDDSDWAAKILTFTAASATTYVSIGVYDPTTGKTTLFDNMVFVATKNYTLRDADLFAGHAESTNGTSLIRCETTTPDAGAVSFATDIDAGGNISYLTSDAILTAGRPYLFSMRAKADSTSGAPQAYLGDSSGGGKVTPELTTSFATYSAAGTAATTTVQCSAWTGCANRTVTIDTVSVTGMQAPPANGAASADEYSSPTDGDPVVIWYSAEGSAYVITQPIIACQPAFELIGINGLPGLAFDGSDDHLRCTTITPLTGLSGLGDVQIRPDSIGAEMCIDGASDEAASNMYLFRGLDAAGKVFIECNDGGTVHRVTGDTVCVASHDYHIQTGSDGSAWWIKVNGTLQTLTVTGANSGKCFGDLSGLDGWTVGALVLSTGATKFFDGLIAELDWFTTVVSASNASRLRNYYRRRYAS